tara:strand:- start:617 stop:1111 length:495 start_codon:yes stop_codon:yes gene_type:complete
MDNNQTDYEDTQKYLEDEFGTDSCWFNDEDTQEPITKLSARVKVVVENLNVYIDENKKLYNNQKLVKELSDKLKCVYKNCDRWEDNYLILSEDEEQQEKGARACCRVGRIVETCFMTDKMTREKFMEFKSEIEELKKENDELKKDDIEELKKENKELRKVVGWS